MANLDVEILYAAVETRLGLSALLKAEELGVAQPYVEPQGELAGFGEVELGARNIDELIARQKMTTWPDVPASGETRLMTPAVLR